MNSAQLQTVLGLVPQSKAYRSDPQIRRMERVVLATKPPGAISGRTCLRQHLNGMPATEALQVCTPISCQLARHSVTGLVQPQSRPIELGKMTQTSRRLGAANVGKQMHFTLCPTSCLLVVVSAFCCARFSS